MTLENKELLLKDICARLPYGPMLNIIYNEFTNESFNARISTVDYCGEIKVRYGYEEYEQVYSLEQIKPYLFPLSSMTEEQKIEIRYLCDGTEIFDDGGWMSYISILGSFNFEINLSVVDWLYKNHIDIYGLIPKGLAIDATGLNIY